MEEEESAIESVEVNSDVWNVDSDSVVLSFDVNYRTIRVVCAGPGCNVIIEQPDRPGIKRIYHSSACRQKAFRARKKRPSPETAAWIRSMEQS